MQSEPANARTLRRDLSAISLDPLTGSELARITLPVGTIIEDADGMLARAEARGDGMLVVRTRSLERPEWVGLERVGAMALRAALQ
jgi:hypothetical protein